MNSSIAWLELLTRKETWTWFSDVPLKILLTIVLAVATRWVLHRVIHRAVGLAISRGERADRTTTQRVFAHATGWDHDRHKQRLETLGTILRSAVTIVIGLIAILTVMALLGIPWLRCSRRRGSAEWPSASGHRAWSRTSCPGSS